MKNTIQQTRKQLSKLKSPMINWHFRAISFFPIHGMGGKTRQVVEDLESRWDVPNHEWVAPDLRDYIPNLMLTRGGSPTTTRITPEDVEGMATSPASIVIYHLALGLTCLMAAAIIAFSAVKLGTLVGLVGVVAVVFSLLHKTFGGSARKSIQIGLFGLGIAVLGFANDLFLKVGVNQMYLMVPLVNLAALAPYVYVVSQEKKHILKLLEQSKEFLGAVLLKTLLGKSEREAQAIQAEKDKRNGAIFIPLCNSLGAFREVISPAVADPGLPLGLSSKDTNRHVYVFGAPGTGKTALLRHIAYEVSKSLKFGIFVVCGKGQLAYDLEKTLDLVIKPSTPYNIIHGLTPVQCTEAMRARYKRHDDKQPFFADGALAFLQVCFEFVHAIVFNETHDDVELGGKKIIYNIRAVLDMKNLLQRMTNNDSIVEIICNLHPDKITQPGPLSEAIYFITEKFPVMPDATKESILANVNLWCSDFTSHPSMAAWAEATEPSVSLEDCFTKKAKIGVGFGDAQGQSGALYLHFINRRFKQLAKEVKNKPNEAYYIFDENSSIVRLNGDDAMGEDVFVSLARSWGIHCVFCCQSMSQLVGRFSKETVWGFLGNFNSAISFKTNEPLTEEYMAFRCGTRPRYVKNNMPSESIDFWNTYTRKSLSPIYDLSNPFRKNMRGFYGLFGIDGGYNHKEVKMDKFPVITTTTTGLDKEILVLDKKLYTRYSEIPRVAIVSLLRAGGQRMDFGRMIGVDEDGNPYPEMSVEDELINFEDRKIVETAQSTRVLLSEGKKSEAISLALAGVDA